MRALGRSENPEEGVSDNVVSKKLGVTLPPLQGPGSDSSAYNTWNIKFVILTSL